MTLSSGCTLVFIYCSGLFSSLVVSRTKYFYLSSWPITIPILFHSRPIMFPILFRLPTLQALRPSHFTPGTPAIFPPSGTSTMTITIYALVQVFASLTRSISFFPILGSAGPTSWWYFSFFSNDAVALCHLRLLFLCLSKNAAAFCHWLLHR